MDLTITRQNLHRALSAVTACLPAKTSLPVLSNILVECVDGGVRISGTDLDLWLRTTVPADVKTPGSVTVPGKKLEELAREMREAPVSMQLQGDQLNIHCGRSQFKVNGLPAEEFPALPEIDFGQGWSVVAKELHELIQKTAFAVSDEESRPVLMGVLWELREDEMRMVATNGHRLARMAVKAGSGGAEGKDFIVPPLALSHVQRLSDPEDEVEAAAGGNHLGFRLGATEVYTRLIEGTYPNYEQVIPKDNDRVARTTREDLARAVRRMGVMTSDQTHKIKLSFAAEQVRMNVTTPDLGEAHDELDVEYAGEPLEIAFNAVYLQEVLKVMGSEEVKMAFKTPERAATIEPGDGDSDYLCLVMPLRLVD